MNLQFFQLICFYGFSSITVVAALSVITLKNTVHAVLALVLTFFSTACLWLLADAEFLALALIVVYGVGVQLIAEVERGQEGGFVFAAVEEAVGAGVRGMEGSMGLEDDVCLAEDEVPGGI